jgi:hypothetical protein
MFRPTVTVRTPKTMQTLTRPAVNGVRAATAALYATAPRATAASATAKTDSSDSMNKTELMKAVAKDLGFEVSDVTKVADGLMKEIKTQVTGGKSVKLVGANPSRCSWCQVWHKALIGVRPPAHGIPRIVATHEVPGEKQPHANETGSTCHIMC